MLSLQLTGSITVEHTPSLEVLGCLCPSDAPLFVEYGRGILCHQWPPLVVLVLVKILEKSMHNLIILLL